jgi:hypothetical protein
VFSYDRMCSLNTKCALLPWNVFAYDRMCSLTIECVLLEVLSNAGTDKEVSKTAIRLLAMALVHLAFQHALLEVPPLSHPLCAWCACVVSVFVCVRASVVDTLGTH